MLRTAHVKVTGSTASLINNISFYFCKQSIHLVIGVALRKEDVVDERAAERYHQNFIVIFIKSIERPMYGNANYGSFIVIRPSFLNANRLG